MALITEENISHYLIKQVTLDAVTVNDRVYQQSLIVMPNKIIFPWRPRVFQDLEPQDFAVLLNESIEVILLGVGSQGGKLPPELYVRLLEKKQVVECMSLAAAARTYSILSAENRAVAAAMVLAN